VNPEFFLAEINFWINAWYSLVWIVFLLDDMI